MTIYNSVSPSLIWFIWASSNKFGWDFQCVMSYDVKVSPQRVIKWSHNLAFAIKETKSKGELGFTLTSPSRDSKEK